MGEVVDDVAAQFDPLSHILGQEEQLVELLSVLSITVVFNHLLKERKNLQFDLGHHSFLDTELL